MTPSRPLRLPGDAPSVAAARAHVRAVLSGHVDDTVLDAAQLCVSELVTNAVLHARTSLEVDVAVHDGHPRLAVRDRSPLPPHILPHSRFAETGRGLALVASLSSDWGVSTGDGGKTVWCLLRSDAGEPDEDELLQLWGEDLDVAGVPEGVDAAAPPIVLRRYPVRLGMRMREHREALLRQCQLLQVHRAASGRGDDDEIGARLAWVTEMLRAYYGPALLGAERVKLAAYLAGEPEADLHYPRPLRGEAVVADFRHMLAELARLLSGSGMATVTAPPDVAALEEWSLQEFSRQLDGLPPTPWPGPWE